MLKDNDDTTVAYQLGVVSGQLKELIHGVNSTSAKLDAIGLRVGKIETLEAERKAERNLIGLLLKSPALAWLVAIGAGAWAIITKRINL